MQYTVHSNVLSVVARAEQRRSTVLSVVFDENNCVFFREPSLTAIFLIALDTKQLGPQYVHCTLYSTALGPFKC